jgi:hypothetical protein
VASNRTAIRSATLVDSCVLLDVITADDQWADWSASQIAMAMDAGRVVINPLIYAEVSATSTTIRCAPPGTWRAACWRPCWTAPPTKSPSICPPEKPDLHGLPASASHSGEELPVLQ